MAGHDEYLESMLAEQDDLDAERELQEQQEQQEQQGDDAPQDSPFAANPLEESDIYDDPNNVNNLARSMKWVPSDSKQENTDVDGSTYAFISLADGPILSKKCGEQIFMLNWLMRNPPHRRRIARTSQMVPAFDSDDNLTTLMERVKLSDDEIYIMEGAREDIGGMRVDAIPLDKVFSYTFVCFPFINCIHIGLTMPCLCSGLRLPHRLRTAGIHRTGCPGWRDSRIARVCQVHDRRRRTFYCVLARPLQVPALLRLFGSYFRHRLQSGTSTCHMTYTLYTLNLALHS
jgi:hypothetical protein